LNFKDIACLGYDLNVPQMYARFLDIVVYS
jgi:hypothetical protein